MMLCCPNCFGDAFLSTIIKRESSEIGTCSFCHSAAINLINPELLNDYFQPLLDLYEFSEEGTEIHFLLQTEWMLFPSLESSIVKSLILLITQETYDGRYAPKKNKVEDRILNWQEFKNELKHDNRYFPQKAPSYEHLKALLNFIIFPKETTPDFLYRARINIDTDMYRLEEMGKPPAKISSAGRANPLGIPYLYTASNIATAIAEIRPHKGDSVTVAKYQVIEPLILADLRNPRQTISPFELDENGLNQVYLDLDYLCHLGEELSKPILPRDAQLEYLSTQYLCELIKHCGFDGVIYKSSVGDGDNYAIFTDNKVHGIETRAFLIDNIRITFSTPVTDQGTTVPEST